MSNINILPQYSTKKFTEIYENVDAFISDYNSIGLPTIISDESCSTLYYLLYARYGNSPIANYDLQQFKMKLFGIVWQYGPTWEKRLDIQSKLRALTDDELLNGNTVIYNHCFNPITEPSTATLDELVTIDNQNTTKAKKSKMDAYAQLWDLLDIDVTNEFMNKFSICFKQFVKPGTFIFESEDD